MSNISALANIPQELRALPQWVVSNDPIRKIPLDPKTGRPASVTNPATWGTFEQALLCLPHCKFIGFVFTKDDPYCVIDLDDKLTNPATDQDRQRFQAIISTFGTYTEISQSGRGVHLICKASVPHGTNKDHVEIYSDKRYVIFTGRVLVNAPIEDRQHLVTPMWEQMANYRSRQKLSWLDAIQSDEEVLKMGMSAVNGSGEKFRKLWEMQPHANQSENDFALLSLLSFYSRSDDQVIRLFRQSGLGQREKAKRDDYLIMSLEKIRDSFAKPEIDFSQLTFTRKEVAAQESLEWPPGLMGKVAAYIYATSNRPVKEISIAAAMAFLTGITARAFNVRGAGLNQYIIILAGTGRGKEDSRKGIDRLFTACRQRTMTLNTFSFVDDFIGPSKFASGEGMIKSLASKPCQLSVIGEVGKKLSNMASKNPPPQLKTIMDNLLDLYNKSGHNDYYRGTAYSQTQNNVAEIKSPALTILGEGSTHSFYESLDSRHIEDGLIPRFLVIEYNGIRVADSEIVPIPPPDWMAEHLVFLFQTAYMAGKNDTVTNIDFDPEAKAAFKQFGIECDARINGAATGVESELWNRAAFKAMKLAGVMAASDNPMNPVINMEYLRYAINLVEQSTRKMLSKFSTGEIGDGDHRQEHDFTKACEAYWSMKPKERRANYKVAERLSEYNEVVPYPFLKKYLRHRASFKNDRRGAYGAIDSMIARLIRDGTLAEVPAEQALTRFETKSIVYTKGREWND